MKGIVKADGPSSLLDSILLGDEESLRLAHLDCQNQLSRRAAQRCAEPALQGSQ